MTSGVNAEMGVAEARGADVFVELGTGVRVRVAVLVAVDEGLNVKVEVGVGDAVIVGDALGFEVGVDRPRDVRSSSAV
jgi:hypothetical protein